MQGVLQVLNYVSRSWDRLMMLFKLCFHSANLNCWIIVDGEVKVRRSVTEIDLFF
jgi:hypothetical protein